MHTPPALTLRPLIASDAETVAAWSLDATFVARAEWTPGLPLADHEKFWRTIIADPPERELLRLGVVHGGALVGYVDLYGLDPAERELGYVIGPSTRWGQGLGEAAARAGLEHAFERLGLASVWAEAIPLNVPSVRILERIGMRYTGTGDEAQFLGATAHYAQYRIAAGDYRAARALDQGTQAPNQGTGPR